MFVGNKVSSVLCIHFVFSLRVGTGNAMNTAQLYVPFDRRTRFHSDPRLALPLVALHFNKVQIQVEFDDYRWKRKSPWAMAVFRACLRLANSSAANPGKETECAECVWSCDSNCSEAPAHMAEPSLGLQWDFPEQSCPLLPLVAVQEVQLARRRPWAMAVFRVCVRESLSVRDDIYQSILRDPPKIIRLPLDPTVFG